MNKSESIERLLISAPEFRRENGLSENSCVSSTNYAIEFLGNSGFLFRPADVHLVASFPGQLKVLGRNPREEAKFNVHRICYDDEFLIDLTLDQIGLAPAAFPFDGKFPIAFFHKNVNMIYFRDVVI